MTEDIPKERPKPTGTAKPIKPAGIVRPPTNDMPTDMDEEGNLHVDEDAFFEKALRLTAEKKSRIMMNTPWDKWKIEYKPCKWYEFWKWPLLLPYFKNKYKRQVVYEIQMNLVNKKYNDVEITSIFKDAELKFV